jgi:hypothetical protein
MAGAQTMEPGGDAEQGARRRRAVQEPGGGARTMEPDGARCWGGGVRCRSPAAAVPGGGGARRQQHMDLGKKGKK